ncbi:MAG TPA: hypothetical protein VNY31_05215 [Solirubrobacteraceae bacterium]|jgi:hypothetical protein|nr:hypothetical protein [Solirubrobacteraceae bacterium]
MSRRLVYGRLLVSGCVACVVCVVACVVPVLACASFVVKPGSFSVVPSSVQAGAHADLTTSFAFVQSEAGPAGTREGPGNVGGLLRGASVVLPVGFAGYPANLKTCAPIQLLAEKCPAASQVGVLEVNVQRGETKFTFKGPVENMTPGSNQTAAFGFNFLHVISGVIGLRLGPDYRVHAEAHDIVSPEVLSQSLTVWGVPADASHDKQRTLTCFQVESVFEHCESPYDEKFAANGELGVPESEFPGVSVPENPVPYLVNPTECTGKPLTAELEGVESWEGERSPEREAGVGPLTGCSSLRFSPTVSLAPEVSQASSPSGYEVGLKVPQSEGAESLATSDLEDTVVRLPRGVVLSPSAATGLGVCTEAEVGLGNEQPVACPDSSKLGTVSVVTPALAKELKGALYLGDPGAPGPITGPPFTLYLTFEGNGVLVKIRGAGVPDPVTGQITTVFDHNPELPFSELKLHMSGGSRAALANPSACGAYYAEAHLTPWASPSIADVLTQSAPFEITGCGSARFAPSFVAGVLSNQAGGYSTFRTTFGREDTDQRLGGLTLTTPPGLSGNLSNVPLCPEPQASEGTCPEASRIGEVTAAAGPGPEPVYTTAGKVFLTGPYNGAPFGLTIDASEHAGPFDLGTGPCDCEVVRASVSVDPHTAQLSVSSGALPTIKDGVPLQVKSVDVDINKPGFMFNPTSCEPLSVNGTLSSTEGMSAPVSSHFQVTNCAALAFQPSFKVSTSGKASRLNGTSLDVLLSFPNKPQGSEANIRKVKVELPKQLPSRLTTLQKACIAAVFEANPANCPTTSVVGYAKAVTPILPVPLTGPAYFVSHGGEAFPSLIVVLQGYGVTIELNGTTFISKAGITSSTFSTVPDVPVGAFELYLPQGRYSALTANTNLCAPTTTKTVKKRVTLRSHGRTTHPLRSVKQRVPAKLVMPTEFVAQNGAEIHRNTTIQVTGCAKPKTTKKKTTTGKTHKTHKARRAWRGAGR